MVQIVLLIIPSYLFHAYYSKKVDVYPNVDYWKFVSGLVSLSFFFFLLGTTLYFSNIKVLELLPENILKTLIENLTTKENSSTVKFQLHIFVNSCAIILILTIFLRFNLLLIKIWEAEKEWIEKELNSKKDINDLINKLSEQSISEEELENKLVQINGPIDEANQKYSRILDRVDFHLNFYKFIINFVNNQLNTINLIEVRSDLKFIKEAILDGHVLITLKSGKVYLARILSASFNQKPESNDVIIFAPIRSGYREPTCKRVTFTTSYENTPETSQYIREIETIMKYDKSKEEYYIQQKSLLFSENISKSK